MNTYFLCATQPGNLGDLVINKMLVDELCLYGKVYVDAYHLPETIKVYLFENQNAIDVNKNFGCTLKRYQLGKVAKIIKSNHIELYTNSPGPLYLLSLYKRVMFRFMHFLIRRQGAKVVNIGGCCSSSIIRGLKFSQIGISEYYLRSFQSVEYLKLQLKEIKISYIPDISLLLRLKVKPNYLSKKHSVAFSFRPDGQNVGELRKQCIRIINSFVKESYSVVLYWQVAKDEVFVRSLYAEFESINEVSLYEKQLWYEDMDFYEDKQFVVSNRLHSLLIGGVYGAVPIVFGDSAVACAKISHVFSSVFKSDLLAAQNSYNGEIDVRKLISNLETMQADADESINTAAEQCRNIISNISNDRTNA